MKITIEVNVKEIAALLGTERLIDSKPDERIRKICDEEFADMTWRDLHSRFPELVKALRAKFPALERVGKVQK